MLWFHIVAKRFRNLTQKLRNNYASIRNQCKTMKTLSDIARELDLSRTAIDKAKSRAEQKYGPIEGTQSPTDRRAVLYTGEQVRQILEFCPRSQSRPPEVISKTVKEDLVASELTIYEPIAPEKVEEFDLSTAIAHFDGIVGQKFDDPASIVDAVEFLTTQVAGGLERKVREQEEKLQETKTQQYRLDAIRDDFQRRTAAAAQQAKTLANQQTEATDKIRKGFEEIANLGKSEPSGSSS